MKDRKRDNAFWLMFARNMLIIIFASVWASATIHYLVEIGQEGSTGLAFILTSILVGLGFLIGKDIISE